MGGEPAISAARSSLNSAAEVGWQPTPRKPPRCAPRRRCDLVGLGAETDVEHPPHAGLPRRREQLFLGAARRERGGCGNRSSESSLGSNSLSPMADPADYYREIYLRGLGGETPTVPVPVAELERRAGGDGGARRELRLRRRRDRGDDARQPRGLRPPPDRPADAARRLRARPLDRVLGTSMPAPLLLAPIGVQRILHEEGELATARAAAALGLTMIASTASHFTLEEIAEAGGPTRRAGSSSTGRTTRSCWRASSAAPRRPATGRSSSPSTPSSPAGSRATCSRPGCPSSKGSATPTTSRTRSSGPASSRRPRRTWAPRPATTSECSPTRP